MIAALRHRGPDDEGIWADARAASPTRGYPLDRSPAGHQPIVSAEETVWITFDGEIYNFMEIRRELEVAGYRLRSGSDTEVIVNGWLAWSKDLFSAARHVRAGDLGSESAASDPCA